MSLKYITAEEAASLINHDDQIVFSGFTAAGCPKAVPQALAKRAEAEHAAGRPFQVSLFTGASTGDSIDGSLARAKAIKIRTPYASNGDLRKLINAREVSYLDLHLSHLAQEIRYGFWGKMNVCIIEACDINEAGEVVPTAGIGNAATGADLADIVIVELNTWHPKELRGMHDVYQPADPPVRREIPLYSPADRIGTPYIKVDPAKIVVVETCLPNEGGKFAPLDDVTKAIGANVANFLVSEMKAGRIPAEFLPVQSGVGNVANAVLGAMGENEEIPAFNVYTEVIQDAVIDLMHKDRVKFASGASLSVSNEVMADIYANLDFFKERVVLRPQELSNNPEIVRRLGLITINTALEADIFGNINSTHVVGTKMMNGIGGSGDFTRNAYLSIYTTPSTAKNGAISAFVPMVSHTDHSEHSVKIIITEYGVADLRGLAPEARANEIIEKCVHPEYRDKLREYLQIGGQGHTPLSLKNAFAFHAAFSETGDMRNAEYIK